MSFLITGGTGSLGRKLVEYLLSTTAGRIVVYSRDECKQAEMAEEFNNKRLRFFLGDVRDRDRLRRALHGITHVVHAAALKRVDAVSYNPSEVIKTNVLGTMNVIDAAIDEHVTRVVLISSDKAVNPTNIYGASKFIAEQYATQANSYCPGGIASVVRYGNVLGSRGSVVLIFKKAIAEGKPVTITDPRCTRFLITFAQAISLIMCSFARHAGEMLIPVLPSIRIVDLAEAMGAKWVQTGLRPGGEKIHESLINEEESTRATNAGKTIIVHPKPQIIRESFVYNSGDNDWFLTVEEIRALLVANGF